LVKTGLWVLMGWVTVAIATACGGSTDDDADRGAMGGASGDGASSGGSESGGSESGGTAAGGADTGGAPTGGAESGGTGGIDCSMVGCAPPPLCAEGCTDVCGCCSCGAGEEMVIDGVPHTCTGGCWAPDAETCTYDGRVYEVGDSFPATDGCNHCFCDASGLVACTAMACFCSPDAEYWRDYVGTPETCPLIDFVCPEGATHFSNECGCGCEQSIDCPEWLDCMPGGAPPECSDLEAYAAICPYTEIAW
jgi:hypothetical protein